MLFCSGVSPSTALVRKMIAVLESIEKLPVYNYDSPGAGYGLQVSTVSVLVTCCSCHCDFSLCALIAIFSRLTWVSQFYCR